MHLSSESDEALTRADAINAAVQSKIRHECSLLVAYTGDITFSGKTREYETATRFLDQVQDRLGSVVLPGNHDCDFSAKGDARPVLLSSVASNISNVDLNGESIEQLLKVQEQFFEFASG